MEKLEIKHLADFPMYKIDVNGNIYSEKRFGSKGGLLKQLNFKSYEEIIINIWEK